MTKKLSGKVAVVTGASKGIGAAIAKQLAAKGAEVVVNYSSSKKGADDVVAEISKNGGKAVAIQANLSQPEEVKKLFSEVTKKYKKVDILVNNAGVYEFAPLEQITTNHFNKMFDLNVLGLLLVTQEAIKHFDPKGGSIVNISSIASTASMPNASVYSATKASVDAITRCLSQELGPKKIRINSINPGMVETEGLHTGGLDDGEFRDNIEARTPLGRVGQTDDIAPAALFLASDDSSWITGQTLFITGGFS